MHGFCFISRMIHDFGNLSAFFQTYIPNHYFVRSINLDRIRVYGELSSSLRMFFRFRLVVSLNRDGTGKIAMVLIGHFIFQTYLAQLGDLY